MTHAGIPVRSCVTAWLCAAGSDVPRREKVLRRDVCSPTVFLPLQAVTTDPIELVAVPVTVTDARGHQLASLSFELSTLDAQEGILNGVPGELSVQS
jgi:hypothetical protein